MIPAGTSRSVGAFHPRDFDGQNLRIARHERGFAEEYIATRVTPLDLFAYTRWERNLSKPALPDIERLAKLLHFPVAHFCRRPAMEDLETFGVIFMCPGGPVDMCQTCGRTAEYLCDWPGCDAPICWRHATPIGWQVDHCPAHGTAP